MAVTNDYCCNTCTNQVELRTEDITLEECPYCGEVGSLELIFVQVPAVLTASYPDGKTGGRFSKLKEDLKLKKEIMKNPYDLKLRKKIREEKRRIHK
jgi:hypothetical protein